MTITTKKISKIISMCKKISLYIMYNNKTEPVLTNIQLQNLTKNGNCKVYYCVNPKFENKISAHWNPAISAHWNPAISAHWNPAIGILTI